MRARIFIGLIGFGLLIAPASPSYAAEAGKTLYTNRCQGCHGPDGKGNQTMAKALKAEIPDLTSKGTAKKPDGDLLEVVSKGKGKMPPAGGLSEKELKELVSHVRSLSKGKK